MPKYIANAYLLHKGKVVEEGEEVDLTVEQATRLQDKVTPVDAEKPIHEKTVPELKEIAKGLDIEGISEMKKDELLEAIKEKQE